MAKTYEELTGIFDHERNVFGSGDDRTIIGRLEDGTTVKGKAREDELVTGLTYLFRGVWAVHPKYGKQFAFHSIGVAQPIGQRGTVSYLTRGPGIGRKRAQQIWDRYGQSALEAIREKPEEVAAAIKGLTEQRAAEAAAYFRAHKDREIVERDLAELLSGGGFPRRLPTKLIEKWGAKAAEKIRANAYCLIRFPGVGYAKADRLYLQLGGRPDTPERLGWCCWAALHKDRDGSVWQPAAFGLQAIAKGIGGCDTPAADGIRWALAEGHVAMRRDSRGAVWIADASKANAERRLANEIHRAVVEGGDATWPIPASLPDLSDHQREQYAAAARGCLSLLLGRPGTGKTTTLSRILAVIPSATCAVAAPTGKAAVRITESLQRAGVQGLRATTIHSLLGPNRDEDSGEWSFAHNEDNPLEYDWVFVDESSMADVFLLGSLLAARKPGARVMLIGDVNQLSPVGPGAPLRDLAAAGLPTGNLVEIFRNSGRIVRCCHGIIDRHRFEPSPAMDLDAESPENLLHLERREPDQQIETLKTILDKFRGGSVITGRRIDPVWDVQILVPVNQKSPLARVTLNRILQGFLNPAGETVDGNPFRIGDKIVNGKNGWLPVETQIPRDLAGGPWNENQKEGKVYAANGEQAVVLAVQPRLTVARLWLPDRIVRIPRGGDNGNQDENNSGDNGGTGCDWQLAYALSTHKAQGSSWPVVITLADAYPGARMLCDCCWIYTSLSRAETLAITIGQRNVIDEMCRKSHIWQRKTFLAESIAELEQAGIEREWQEALA